MCYKVEAIAFLQRPISKDKKSPSANFEGDFFIICLE